MWRRRTILAAGALLIATIPLGAVQRPRRGPPDLADQGPVTPEMFGARGDGRTDDSDAFAAMAAFVNRRGGGEIALRATTYQVGRQEVGRHGYAFGPAAVMEFSGLRRPLVIRGGGAVVRCAPDLRYGTFDRATGRATVNALPYADIVQVASPYMWMIKVERCAGPIEISDIELDGNCGSLVVGGPFGDVGRQLPATGIGLYDNSGPETLRNVHTHHHALDGIIIDGLDAVRAARSRLVGVTCDRNGRQGVSVVGGRGYDFEDCRFNHTGRGGITSAPGAGVDIEAEAGKRIKDLTFTNCDFVDNVGPGLLADQGLSEGARFMNCRFVGTTAWSAWPFKPGMRFERSTFVGPIVNCYGSAGRPDQATQFDDCAFRDDPALTPTGRVYVPDGSDGPIADLGQGQVGVTFRRCSFYLTHDHVLPWTTAGTIFENCAMSQASRKTAYPRGTFRGRNTIRGPVDLSGGVNEGHLTVNGAVQSRRRF